MPLLRTYNFKIPWGHAPGYPQGSTFGAHYSLTGYLPKFPLPRTNLRETLQCNETMYWKAPRGLGHAEAFTLSQPYLGFCCTVHYTQYLLRLFQINYFHEHNNSLLLKTLFSAVLLTRGTFSLSGGETKAVPAIVFEMDTLAF